MFSLPIDYWRLAALEKIGNKLGTFIQASEATVQKRYTSCVRICVEINISGALHECLWLEYRDEVFFQAIDYEQIPFRCRKCHEHGHLIRECPLHKPTEKAKDSSDKNQDGFFRPLGKHRTNRRNPPKTGNPNKGSMNAFEVLGEETAAKENTQTLAAE